MGIGSFVTDMAEQAVIEKGAEIVLNEVTGKEEQPPQQEQQHQQNNPGMDAVMESQQAENTNATEVPGLPNQPNKDEIKEAGKSEQAISAAERAIQGYKEGEAKGASEPEKEGLMVKGVASVVESLPIVGDAYGIASSIVSRGSDAVGELFTGDFKGAAGSLAAMTAEIVVEGVIPDNPLMAAGRAATSKRLEESAGDLVKGQVTGEKGEALQKAAGEMGGLVSDDMKQRADEAPGMQDMAAGGGTVGIMAAQAKNMLSGLFEGGSHPETAGREATTATDYGKSYEGAGGEDVPRENATGAEARSPSNSPDARTAEQIQQQQEGGREA